MEQEKQNVNSSNSPEPANVENKNQGEQQQPQQQQQNQQVIKQQVPAVIANIEKKVPEMESNILVAIRVRPLNIKEENQGDWDIIRIEDQLIIVLDPVEMEFASENRKMLEVYHRSKEQRYAFDKIFRLHSQEEVYSQTCRHLIKPVIQGFNATVFAYGPTGTGKTYTMLGNQDTPGLCTLTIQDIFQFIKKDSDNEYQVTITYVEIYNETIRDLLVPHSTYLELRDDPLKGITIAGVTESKAESVEQVMNLLFLGNKRRTTEATNANQTSSRSHAVFQVTVNSRSRTKNTEQENLQGKLSLIDLAGSERGTVTENRGIRLREGAKINQSLLALANCINALGDKSKKGFFVPYRDSKLTRMLKDSLGGNCKTVMIANVSPSSAQFEETINTLKYANRAKNIKTKVQANKRLVSMHIAEYKNIINDLRSEIEQLKAKLHDKIGDNNDILNYQEEEQQYLEKQHLNQLPNVISGNCICGRQEDEQNMRKIQEEIFENFQNRIQLRRGLMEVEEQNAMNILEIKKKQAEILVWKKSAQYQGSQENNIEDLNIDDSLSNNQQQQKEPKKKIPEEIKQLVKAVRTLKVATEKNTIRKEMMTLSLLENIANAKLIRDRIPKKIKHQDKRNYLELVIKNHVLELQNIEMEINLQIQEKTIQDLKNIIESQRKIINENNINSQANGLLNEEENNILSNYSQDDIDIEFQDIVDEDDLNEDKDNQDDDEEDMNDITDLQEMIQKQKELSSPMNNNAANNQNQDDFNMYEKPNKRDDLDKNGNKRGSSRTDVLPEINQNKRDKSAAGYNNKHSSKSSQDNMIKNQFNDNEINKETLNEIDENNNEGFNSTPKMVQGNLKGEKKKEQIDQKKKNHNKQQNPKKKEGTSAIPNNVQISIQGQAAIQNSKESGSLNIIQSNQGGGINNISNNVNSMSNINSQLNGNNININNNNNNNNKGMPQIGKQNNQQPQKDKDFSGLNLKGKNIILPALNSNNNNQSNINNNNNNNPSSNPNIPNNNFLKDANAQNRKKR
ncbi:kinesin motor catalytic domain protein (macronuclear) [Tetrahymena thermophila SB210]|uniref:Kinesin-like protein KIN-8B n=1 Tax=Tetrahymena thermophila (strain SB210) TaxID=312017 RepID=A4VDB5_TETTS|nr:kinesin motor catalytic domain protein [Tetrahymena thermophila SB210]EDK31531.2 kinesin motor catalytic domain protein [Tetrahymena thermophila SB210]|eukprot:XP_001470911.2 kinesin motor catalytic domain protein [Tetrahymena thermophila SB210]